MLPKVMESGNTHQGTNGSNCGNGPHGDVAGPGELLETPQDMMFKACATIADRQMSLSQAKIQLEVQESMARERIKSLVKCVERLASRIEDMLGKRLTEVVGTRRTDLEEISNFLSCSSPQIVKLCSGLQLETGDKADQELHARVLRQRLNKIMSDVNARYSGEAWEIQFLSEIKVADHNGFHQQFSPNYALSEYVGIFGVLLHGNIHMSQVEVKGGVISCSFEFMFPPSGLHPSMKDIRNFFPYIALSELDLQIGDSQRMMLPRATFKDLKTRGLISQSDYRTLNFSMLYDTSEWNNVDLMVMARLNEKIVLNGHQAISLTLARPDLLPPTCNGNASRYQQDNRDLDESDMRAMGYIDMTLGGPGGTLVPPHKLKQQQVQHAAVQGQGLASVHPQLSVVVEEKSDELSAPASANSSCDSRKNRERSSEESRGGEPAYSQRDPLQEFLRNNGWFLSDGNGTERKSSGSQTLEAAAKSLQRQAASMNLPLNQPSPVTTAVRRVRQEPLAEDGSESPGFTPSVASTSGDLSAKLGQLNIPKLIERLAEVDLEEEGRDEDQVLHSDEKLDIDSIQESLKPQPLATVEPTVAKEAVVQVNGGDAPTTAAAMARLSRNVSFNPETTIYEQVSVDAEAASNKSGDESTKVGPSSSFETTQPYQPGSMEVRKATLTAGQGTTTARDHQWQLRTGTTKTADGEFGLCKSLLKAANESSADSGSENVLSDENSEILSNQTSFTDWGTLANLSDQKDYWNYNKDEWNETLKAKISGGGQLAHDVENQESYWLDEDKENEEPTERQCRAKPDFDLMKTSSVGYTLLKTFNFCNRDDVVPQSIARDPGLDVTYVSDINNNCIHYYKGWEYEGVWHIKTESLLHPRYILCINDVKHDNRHGMLLLVLDQVALYVFKADGSLKSKTFVDEAKKYRGLAFNSTQGRLMTTQRVEEEGTYLVFIDSQSFDKVVKRILLEPTTRSGYYQRNTKCRFLTCDESSNRVITTDLGLGCFYITDLSTEKTTDHSHSERSESGANVNRLQDVTDTFVDPAGNIVVATCTGKEDGGTLRGDLEVFTTGGAYAMPLKGIEVMRPVGVLAEGRNLYVVDVRSKLVYLYGLAESLRNSPVKKAPNAIL